MDVFVSSPPPKTLNCRGAVEVKGQENIHDNHLTKGNNVRTILLSLLLIGIGPGWAISDDAPPKKEFLTGQVWTYDTRPGEAQSRLYIMQVDRVEGVPPIFHISLDHLSLHNPNAESGLQTSLPHLAVWQESLRRSVDELTEHRAKVTPAFTEDYNVWINTGDPSQGGAYSMPIKDVLDAMEAALRDSTAAEQSPTNE